jgi:DNA uptake protein ComE-like DNA-binding protein
VPIAGASVAMSEASKLDLNTATAEMLSLLPGLGDGNADGDADVQSAATSPATATANATAGAAGDSSLSRAERARPRPSRLDRGRRAGADQAASSSVPAQDGASDAAVPVTELARRVVAMRDGGRLPNAEVLGEIEGMTRDLLDGSAGGVAPGMGGLRRVEIAEPGLLDVVGVFAAEPEESIGVTGTGADSATRGLERIAARDEWTDEVRAEMLPRVSAAALAAIERLLSAKNKPADESDAAAKLIESGVPPVLIGEVLDAIAFGDDAFRLGRVDIGRATARVIAAIPGFDAESAERLVQERARLDPDSLRRVSWPLERGLIEPEEFAKAARWITTRSLVWRVRVEVRLESMSRRESMGSQETGADGRSEGLLGEEPSAAGEVSSGPVSVVEAVIDVSGDRPRVAYLRDITMRPVARDVESRIVASDEPPEIIQREPEVAAAEQTDPGRDIRPTRTPRPARERTLGSTLDPSPGGLLGSDADEEGPVASSDRPEAAAKTQRQDRRIGRWAPRRP